MADIKSTYISEGHYDPEKLSDHSHHEGLEETERVIGFTAEEHTLPPGYFTSSFFLGSMTAIGMGLMAATAGFGYAAPILGYINADIGMISSFSIVNATAKDVNTLIGGNTLIGVAAAAQLSYYYVMGELVPMKYRFTGNGFCYLFTLPASGFAPAIGNAFLLYTNVSWRGLYYVLIAMNGTSLLCWVLFYHPPTFNMKHRNESKMKYIKNFDYVGTILYAGGLLIFLMGLSWGGSVYSWKSAHVIACIVVGFVALVALVSWESFATLKEPLVPMHLFRNGGWVSAVVVSGLGASLYYAFAIVWPSMVGVLYADGDQMYGGWLATLLGLMIILGEIASGFAARHIGKVKYQVITTLALGGIFFACMATCTAETKVRACCLVSIGVFFIGYMEGIALTMTTVTLKNQQELGTGGGVAGSIRFLISSISATVYTLVLTNRLATTVPAEVVPAITNAGLPASSVVSFIEGFTTGSFAGVKGVTPAIIAIGTKAYQLANADAYRTVFLSTIAFTGAALVASMWLPNVDDLMTEKVATTLHKRGNEEVVGS